MEEYQRDPCPYRIVDDCGGAFTMGCIGGAGFQALKGFRNAPKGFIRRLNGGVTMMKARSPAIAGQFAIWGAVFSAVDCTLVRYRRREDPWNGIISGTVTGGVLAARRGIMGMAGSAIVGGLLLSMIEGMGILFTHLSAEQFRNPDPMKPLDSQPSTYPLNLLSDNNEDIRFGKKRTEKTEFQ